ncbi:hypothetical protein LOZ18_005623 [Ophidiomyces ophidiicola]|nr:hypothetical protein LOZ18_005623 [Ophidiomyces ophidiicola]
MVAAPEPAPSAHPDTITFTVNPRTLSMDEKAAPATSTTTTTTTAAAAVPAAAAARGSEAPANPVSVRAVGSHVAAAPLGITLVHAAVAVSSIVAVILLAVAISKETGSDRRGYYSGLPYVPIATVHPLSSNILFIFDRRQLTPSQVCLSALWALVALAITRLARTRLHPAFYVAFDLLLWLSLISISACLLAIIGAVDDYACQYPSSSRRRRCYAEFALSYRLQLAANVLAVLSGIGHFGIFVWGCKAVHSLNSHARFEVTINVNGLTAAQAAQPAPLPAPGAPPPAAAAAAAAPAHVSYA